MGCESIFYIKVKKDNNWAFLPLIKENDFGDKELAHFYFCGWEILDIIKDYAQPTFLTDEDYEATGYEKDEDYNEPGSYEMSYALIKYLAAKEYSEAAEKIAFQFTAQWSEPKYQCPKCGGGMCKNLMVTLTTYPAQYEYQCDKCGYIEYQFG